MSRSCLPGCISLLVLLSASTVHADDTKERVSPKLPTVIRQSDDGWHDSNGPGTGSKAAKALDRPVTLDFKETPFQQIVEFLRDYTGLQIYLNPVALDDLGIDLDHPISISLSEMPLRDVLDLLLSPLGLTHHVANNDLLLITDEDEPLTRVYPVVDILSCKSLSGPNAFIVKEYRELIIESISPDSWAQNGGLGTIAFSPINSSFVITTSSRVHTRIERLLEDLRLAGNATETWLQANGPEAQKAHGMMVLTFGEEAMRQRLVQEQRHHQQQVPSPTNIGPAPQQSSQIPPEVKQQTDSLKPVIETLQLEFKHLREELSRLTGIGAGTDNRR